MNTKERLDKLVKRWVEVRLGFGSKQTEGYLVKIPNDGSRFPTFYSVGNPDRDTFIPFRPSAVIAIDDGKMPTLILIRQEYTGG
jgi:hypothetical protein